MIADCNPFATEVIVEIFPKAYHKVVGDVIPPIFEE